MYTKSDLWRLWLELFWLKFDFKAKVFILVPGELPIMAGEGPHDRGTFCRPQVYERVVILPVEVYERVGKGNLSFRFGKRSKRPNRCILWLWKNRKNVLVLWLIHISKTLRLQQFEGMQSYKLVMWKGYRSSIEGRRKGHLSCQKWYIKE